MRPKKLALCLIAFALLAGCGQPVKPSPPPDVANMLKALEKPVSAINPATYVWEAEGGACNPENFSRPNCDPDTKWRVDDAANLIAALDKHQQQVGDPPATLADLVARTRTAATNVIAGGPVLLASCPPRGDECSKALSHWIDLNKAMAQIRSEWENAGLYIHPDPGHE